MERGYRCPGDVCDVSILGALGLSQRKAEESSVMLGVNCDDRESVHGYTKVAWRRTLGWKQRRAMSSEL